MQSDFLTILCSHQTVNNCSLTATIICSLLFISCDILNRGNKNSTWLRGPTSFEIFKDQMLRFEVNLLLPWSMRRISEASTQRHHRNAFILFCPFKWVIRSDVLLGQLNHLVCSNSINIHVTSLILCFSFYLLWNSWYNYHDNNEIS